LRRRMSPTSEAQRLRTALNALLMIARRSGPGTPKNAAGRDIGTPRRVDRVSAILRLLYQRRPSDDSKLREGFRKPREHFGHQLVIAEVSQRRFIEFRIRHAPD
jgi:hypothetical protein